MIVFDQEKVSWFHLLMRRGWHGYLSSLTLATQFLMAGVGGRRSSMQEYYLEPSHTKIQDFLCSPCCLVSVFSINNWNLEFEMRGVWVWFTLVTLHDVNTNQNRDHQFNILRHRVQGKYWNLSSHKPSFHNKGCYASDMNYEDLDVK